MDLLPTYHENKLGCSGSKLSIACYPKITTITNPFYPNRFRPITQESSK